MKNSIDYIELVQQAQLGDKDCLNRLAEAVRKRLYFYVYRYTLKKDITNDIVQDSILKMLESIGKLREAEQFWAWLYKIALNKIHLHYRKEQRHQTISDPDTNGGNDHNGRQEVIAGMVYEEFRETVFKAMGELKPDHRSIINMRCYDQMPYSEIAKVIGRSEFAAQKLFYRAKKSLKKKLVRYGLGKGSLLMALVLFGKLTAPSKAAAAGISVTSATVKVGAAAAVTAMASSKTAIVSLTAAGALTVGAVVATSGPETGGMPIEKPAESSYSHAIGMESQAGVGNREYWYYYPSKASDVIMMQVKGSNGKGKYQYCQYLQNAEGNYHYDSRENTIHIENFRMWKKDLSVWRLPTDSSKLSQFLTTVDGVKGSSGGVRQSQSGMLLVVKHPGGGNDDQLAVTRHVNVLGEDYFKYDWPADVKVVDNRDAMHKRGWTYFTVSGQINGQKVEGAGRLPFVYAASRQHWPWMRLRIGSQVFMDKEFVGLARPWAGLHTIDTVRRDAAEKEIPSEIKLHSGDRNGQVILTKESGRVIYTIDMEKDVVEQIVFTDDRKGRLVFDYLDNADDMKTRFAPPPATAKVFSILDF